MEFIGNKDQFIYKVKRGEIPLPTTNEELFELMRGFQQMPDFKKLKSWPFKDMEVGDVVSFTENIESARMAAYSYASSSNPRIKIKTMLTRNPSVLRVKRIA